MKPSSIYCNFSEQHNVYLIESKELTNSQSTHIVCNVHCNLFDCVKYIELQSFVVRNNYGKHSTWPCVCTVHLKGFENGVRLNLMKSFHEMCNHRNMVKFARSLHHQFAQEKYFRLLTHSVHRRMRSCFELSWVLKPKRLIWVNDN